MSAQASRQSDSKQPSSAKGEGIGDYQEVREDFQSLIEDVGGSISEYCRRRPQMASLAIFAIGFYVGWKVKPW